MKNVTKTLFHPFETNALFSPSKDSTVLFLGAEPGFRLPDGFDASIFCVQGFRPSFLKLQHEGRSVAPLAEGDGHGMALVLASRHRGLSELRVAEALARTRAGGLIVVAGGKDDGIVPLMRRMAALVPIDGQSPKHHGVAFWLTRPANIRHAVETLRVANPETIVEGRFHVAPGMFSAGGMDAGSRLLAEQLPHDIKGAVADFCAGWGYLSHVVAERCPGISALDLYEADHASLEAAKRNLADVPHNLPIGFFWHDLASEEVARRYDAIVMNPPFHMSRKAEPDLGKAMIQAASKALKRGGRLFMVANRQLPYEAALASNFTKVEKLAEADGFKLFCATR